MFVSARVGVYVYVCVFFMLFVGVLSLVFTFLFQIKIGDCELWCYV